jgi:hypothetical protein
MHRKQADVAHANTVIPEHPQVSVHGNGLILCASAGIHCRRLVHLALKQHVACMSKAAAFSLLGKCGQLCKGMPSRANWQ